ncbi:MAG: tetratricopeptide repeat protein, partial [Prevotella sp.]|nr:tetratricopeptide repeat protein [Prevotella sp.]
MKKLITILCYLLFCSCYLFSQNNQNPLPDYLRSFQYQKALDYIETQEQTKELLIQKALCYKALGNYQKSLEILYPLSKEYATDVQIITEMAVCYEALSQRQASVDCYDELIRLDSANVYFKMQKADLLYQQGKYKESLELFRYVSKEHMMTNALKRVGQCFEKMNIADSAMMYFKEAWEVNPKDGFSAASLVNLCLKSKRSLEAVSYSDMYMEADTTDQQMNLLNALSYYSIDDYETAITKFEKCYEKGDSSLIVNRSLGLAYYSLNDSYTAQPFLERAYEMDTTNNNVLYCLAVTCNDMGEHKKAIPHFLRLLDRTIPPDLTLYLYYRNLGSAYDKGSHYQEAVDSYTKALAYGGENQQMNLYYMIGNISEYYL